MCLKTLISVVIIDRVTKCVANRNLEFNELKTVIKNKLYFIKTKNYGFARGIMSDKADKVKVFSGLCLIVTAIYGVFGLKGKKNSYKIGYSLIFGGGLSNFIDRCISGYVTDFISFKSNKKGRSPLVYNIADFFIFAGSVIILVNSLFEKDN